MFCLVLDDGALAANLFSGLGISLKSPELMLVIVCRLCYNAFNKVHKGKGDMLN